MGGAFICPDGVSQSQGVQRGSLRHLEPRWPGSTPTPHPALAWPLPLLPAHSPEGGQGNIRPLPPAFRQREDERSVGTGGPLWGPAAWPGGQPLPLPWGLRPSGRERLGGGCWAGGSPGRGQQLPVSWGFWPFGSQRLLTKAGKCRLGVVSPSRPKRANCPALARLRLCPAAPRPGAWCAGAGADPAPSPGLHEVVGVGPGAGSPALAPARLSPQQLCGSVCRQGPCVGGVRQPSEAG